MPPNTSIIARPTSTGLYDVLDLILDKGLVIDVYVRVSVVGLELITIDARIVIASVDTYLRFAEAAGRLNLEENGQGLTEFAGNLTSGVAKGKTRGAVEGTREGVSDAAHRAGSRIKEAVTRDGSDDDADDDN